MNWTPFILSLKLAAVTSIVLLLISIPIAYKLSRSNHFLKPFFEALISLPLVLPPTVLGFYLLLAFSPNSSLGAWLHNNLHLNLIFSFEGLVFASVIYSLPFMVHPIQSGFSSLPKQLEESAYVLGKSKWTTLHRVLIPNIKLSIITGFVLSFAHTIGEFGVVLMIGGNIPGVSRVASIAIYDEVESMNYALANKYSMALILLSFVVLVYSFNKKALKGIVK